jgi:hypothetical protein
MKNLSVLFLLTLGLAASTALAAPFSSPHNVVVLRCTGAVNTGNAGFLDEYTPAGSLVQSITLPQNGTTDTGSSIVFGITALSHETSLSGDGAFVVIPGYAAMTAGAVESSTASANHRVIATVKYDGTYALANTNANWASAASVRGAASDGYGNFWGDWTAGVSYLGNHGSYAALVTGGWRASAVVNGTLYVSLAAGVDYFTVGGTPTSGSGLGVTPYLVLNCID